ncbi:MAG TPA: dipeptide/oligopeptide/nickel ABC transporter permease/ATP-binding protein [Solirubrobacteraceae bacterium]|nr:dipeptide/oligopeptide/nickel ABC transporter permease/ATP-binding protein [Solirubrobacteraceae bacterium]
MKLLRALLARPLAAFSLTVLTLIALAAIFAPLLAPDPPNYGPLTDIMAGPSWAHPLGTDELGRDLLSRLMYGARPAILQTLEVVGTTILIGLPLGLFSGYVGGRTDRILMRVVDIGLAIPAMVVILIVLSVFPTDFYVATVTLGILLVAPFVRNIRGAVIAVRGDLFVDAARVAGLSTPRIISRHILPRVRGPVLVQATLLSAIALLFTSGLGYLGFGVQPPNPSWGTMVGEAQRYINQDTWMLVDSGGIVALTVLCFGLLGDAIRDVTVEAWTGSLSPSGLDRAQPEENDTGAAPDGEALLSVRGLRVVFPARGGEVAAVDGVDFDVAPGEAVGLIGESGCGKTSVARALMRLLRGEGRIAAGSILFEGVDVLSLDREQLRRFRGSSIAYISQEPLVSLDPTCRVGSILRGAIRAHERVSRAQADARCIELLEMVRLPEPERVLRLYPHELSGGMAQRVAIARALATRPRLLIADEPTTALDVTTQAEILDLLRGLARETGMALLFVSHDCWVVSELCTRVLVMYAGQVVERAPVQALFEHPAHPYSERLLRSDPRSAIDTTQPLPTIPGSVPAPGAWPRGCHFMERCPYAREACGVAPVVLTELGDGRHSRCLFAQELLERGAIEVAL